MRVRGLHHVESIRDLAARAAQAAGIQVPELPDVGAAADELGATAGSVRETVAGAAEAVNGAVTEAPQE